MVAKAPLLFFVIFNYLVEIGGVVVKYRSKQSHTARELFSQPTDNSNPTLNINLNYGFYGYLR